MVDEDALVGVLLAEGLSEAADDVALLLKASKRV